VCKNRLLQPNLHTGPLGPRLTAPPSGAVFIFIAPHCLVDTLIAVATLIYRVHCHRREVEMTRRFILDLDDTLGYTTRDIQGKPERIDKLQAVEGALEFLKVHWRSCILLTAGIEADQQRKIDVLGIRKCFKKIYIVRKPEEKPRKLEEIVRNLKNKSFGISPFNVVVIGDRLDTELRTGKALKCVTVRIKIPGGRHSNELPKEPLDVADFEEKNFADLMQKFEYFRY
jgi:FMN phosphatase YigB (HAD superfamily)